uniref:Uncharacterized protein n=1 Tax=Ditylum brightwellii TaxID=49249 RepID=A0A6S9DVA2_9STRA
MMRRAATILATKHKKSVVRIPTVCSQILFSSSSTTHVQLLPDGFSNGKGTSRSLATRRRRSRSMGGTVGNPLGGADHVYEDERNVKAPNAVLDQNLFSAAAEAFLDKVEVAIKPMQECNDVFVITRVSKGHPTTEANGGRLTIDLKPGDGSYILQVDEDDKTLKFSSPMSGNYTYVLGSKTHEFVGMDDGHILEGMIVRGLIQQCNGMPKF